MPAHITCTATMHTTPLRRLKSSCSMCLVPCQRLDTERLLTLHPAPSMPTVSYASVVARGHSGGAAGDKAPPVESSTPPKAGDAAAGALASDAVAVVYAPVLPIDVLRIVFAPLACDVETLSAAACVSVAWHAAALEPALWRLTRLSFSPRAARKLTNQALHELVLRTGSSLQRVNLVGCTQLHARDVAKTFRGMELDTLAMRGVRFPSNSRIIISELQRVVRRLDCLDVSESPTCGTQSEQGWCPRLCGPQDMLCDICSVARCTLCVESAKARRKPPCRHLCDICFRGSDTLLECEVCGRVPNGFCPGCMIKCATCELVFCDDCCYGAGALLSCAGRCGVAFCHACFFAAGSLVTCRNWPCSRRTCTSCAADGERMAWCDRCDEPAYCLVCAEMEDGEVVCPNCMSDSDSDVGESGDDSD